MTAPIRITGVDAAFEPEALVRPFGFKGGYLRSIWQVVVRLDADSGKHGIGVGTQNVLWSDPRAFASSTEAGGNARMFAVTEFALGLVRGRAFRDPIELLDGIFDEVHAYARAVTGIPDLKATFALNALVPLDLAAWVLYARERGISRFDDLVPEAYRPALAHRHERVAAVPIASFGMPLDEVRSLVLRDGFWILKFKLGSPGTQAEMLERDMAWLEAVHRAVGHVRVEHTEDGRLPYYLDLNGRYVRRETLERLLDHARRIGAFDQIRIVEEPFPEEVDEPVGDLGVLVAADESAHTPANVEERIELGYGAIALKAVAKTLSTTLRMAKVAADRGVPCFCADLTTNPVLLEWNRNVAARLAPLPGFRTGLLESNGHQNYAAWERLLGYHPVPGAPWLTPRGGVFELGDAYFATGGGVFEDSPHYASLVGA